MYAFEVVETHIFQGETGKTPNRIKWKIRKPDFIFAEKPRMKWNRKRKPQVSKTENPKFLGAKTDLKNGLTRETENPITPSL